MARTKLRSERKAANEDWRDNPDRSHRGYKKLPSAASLHPDHRVIEAYAAGAPIAKAIIRAWQPSMFYSQFIIQEAM